jgi:hypothetical protein
LIPIIQPEAFDVAGWLEDEMFFNYPEGARSKRAFFPPAGIKWQHIIHGRRYLYKRSDKRYIDQFWGEVVAYHVGCMLNIDVPITFAAYDSRIPGDCGSLSQWFYEDGKTAHVLGGNWMQRLIPDFDHKKGRMHNFRSVEVWGKTFAKDKDPETDWGLWWANAFLFDALIGNTDRHQNNWGYLISRRGGDQEIFFLSPLFDNGTSLGHELFPGLVANWDELRFQNYIMRGRNHMKWHITDVKGCGHFDMVVRMVDKFPGVKQSLRDRICNFSIEELARYLNRLKSLDMPIMLQESRIDLYLKLISLRQQKLLAVLT